MCPFHHAAGNVLPVHANHMAMLEAIRLQFIFAIFYFARAKLTQVILWQRRSRRACSHGCCDFWQMNIQESLNFFQTYQYLLTFLTYLWPFFLTHSFWTSCKHIFWHSIWLILWHLATTSLTHSFCNYYQSFPSQLRPGTPHWTRMIAVGVRHATLNSRNRSWGPAHNTELTRSQWGSGTPHWTRRIAVGVRHATLHSQDRGWGPARHTELTGSQLRSDEEEDDRRRRRRRRRSAGEETDIKSNNPHLTGGEKLFQLISINQTQKTR